jgi:hypothetical protein
MDVFAKDPASPAVLYAGVLSAVSSQIGQLSASETTGITDESNEQMTVTTTTSTALSTNAAVGGPGQGDVIYFLHDVKMAWAYVDGRLRLAPLGYRNAVFPIATLQQQAASLGLSDDDVAALLAFDPFVAGGPGASLPTERFEERDTWEYQNITGLHLTDTVTRDTKFQDTHTDYSTKTSEWEAGPLLKALGFGEKDQTTVKVSNSTGSDVSTTITLDANLSAGPSEHFIVNVWYDKLFGTFAFQADTPAKDARLRGNGAKPGQQVRLSAGGWKFVTVADRSGRYAFFARSIPKGRGMVSVGAGLTRPVDIA